MARTALMNVMIQTVLKAGRGLTRDFGEVENLQVSVKGPDDFATAASRRANQTLVAELGKARPTFGCFTLEHGEIQGSDSASRWIVEPLDGTVNFHHGIPLFAISVALETEGKIVAGIVYSPIINELYVAERGSGAFLNDRRLRVAARRNLAGSVIGVSTSHLGKLGASESNERAPINLDLPAERLIGSPALELAWIASGRYDGFWYPSLRPWSVAAGSILVREAGGFVTDRQGNDRDLQGGSIVAGNRATHEQILSLLGPVPAK